MAKHFSTLSCELSGIEGLVNGTTYLYLNRELGGRKRRVWWIAKHFCTSILS